MGHLARTRDADFTLLPLPSESLMLQNQLDNSSRIDSNTKQFNEKNVLKNPRNISRFSQA